MKGKMTHEVAFRIEMNIYIQKFKTTLLLSLMFSFGKLIEKIDLVWKQIIRTNKKG